MSLTPYQFRFTGTAGRYFPIWIVNTLLIAVTAGAWYAWAKVRSKKFFYQHTTVAKAALEYHGSAMSIFKGWLLAMAFFAAGYVAVILNLENALPFVAALIFMLPWVICRSLSYRARHTSYRGIRFDFDGGFEDALVVYVLLPVLTLLTAGLAFPYLYYRHKRFVIENHWFGGWKFTFRAGAGDFYFSAVIALILIAVGAGGGWALFQYGPEIPELATLAPLLAPSLAGLFVMIGICYFLAATCNLTWNATVLDKNNFKSNIGTGRLFGMYFVNLIALGISGGLLMPWVKVRMARYRGQTLQMIAVRDMEKLIPGVPRREIGDAEAFGEGFAMEFGL